MDKTSIIALNAADGGGTGHGDAVLGLHAVDLGGQAPEWIKLVPLGETAGVDGRRFRMPDLAAAQSVVAASLNGRDLPIDYDHAIDLAAPHGAPAPAAGWIQQLEARGDGIWGKVAWTERAANSIKGREYRFISPVFLHTKDGGVVLQLLRAALTNNPNIDSLPALSSAGSNREVPMDKTLEQLLTLLGMAKDTTVEKALAAVKDALERGTAIGTIARSLGLAETTPGKDIATALQAANTARDKIAAAVGLAAGASADDIVKAIAAVKTADVAKLQADVLALNSQLVELRAKAAKDEVTAEVDKAVREGKVAPAARDAVLAMAQADLAKFREYIAKTPVVLAPGTDTPAGAPPRGGDGTTAAELAICAAMALSADDYKKIRDAEVKQ